MTDSTSVDGPRSQLVRLSTGRTVELRVVPSFRAMQREGLIDKRGAADFLDVFAGVLNPSMLGDELEDALLRHLLIDPPLVGLELGALDDQEVQEIVARAARAYLAAQGPVQLEDDDDDEVVAELAELETDAAVDPLAAAESRLPPAEILPESGAPEIE